jgi:hypothetical protein
VVTTRTQPLLSCMTIAKMKRGSTPDEAETFLIAALMSEISVGELLAPHPLLAQDCCMMGMLAVNIVSKSTHAFWEGQPAATVPLPEESMQRTYQMLSQEGALTAGFQDMKVSVEMPLAEAMA